MRLPRELRHPLLLVFVVLYALLFSNRRWGYLPLPAPVNSYLADVLALPVLLTLALAFMRWVYFRQGNFTLPLAWVISAGLGVSLWFEVLLPWWQPGRATGDPYDVLAYAAGGLIFWRWLNKPD